MLSLTILNCISFGLYGQLKMTIGGVSRDLHSSGFHQTASILERGEFMLAGALTGATSSPISTPFEMVKVRLQLDNVTTQRYRGSWHCARDIARTEGIRMLYRGFLVNTVRESIFCASYFGLYESAKALLRGLMKDTRHSFIAIPLSGGFAGMAGWLSSYPLDVIKSNIQGARPGERKSFTFYLKQRWARGGLRAFFTGIGPSLLRAFIVSGIRFSAYELTIAQLAKWKAQKK